MKCEGCLELLDEYLDGELAERESGEVAAHLITCSACASQSSALAAEQEMFSRYDRDLEVPSFLWKRIAEQTVEPVSVPVSKNGFASLFSVPATGFSSATAVALILIALVIGAAYLRSRRSDRNNTAVKNDPLPSRITPDQNPAPESERPQSIIPSDVTSSNTKRRARKSSEAKPAPLDQSDVLSSDLGYQDMDDQDTAKHLEQTQNLLRSIRNVQLNEGDQEIDVTYDKALSRRLLNENIVLRRDAEMKAKFPTKALLSDLEPFLIDIANLPDQARPEDVRVIKERVQKTEIVAALIGYE